MFENFKKTGLVLLLLFICMTLPAKALTLNEAIDAAVKKSRSVETAKNNLEKEINNSHVKTWLPTFSASASISDRGDLLHSPEDSLKYPTISLSTGVKWNFSTTDILKESTSNLSVATASMTLESQINSIKKNVSTSFYNLISLRYAVSQAEDSVNNSKINYNRTLEMYRDSRAPELSLLQSKLSYDDSNFALENAKTNYNNALDDFKTLTGIEGKIDFPSEPDTKGLKFSKLESLAQQYYDKVVAVRRAEVGIKTAKLNKANNITTTRTPSLALNSSLNYNGEKVRDKDFASSLNLSATVTATVPIDPYLPWTQANANAKNNDINLDNAELELASAQENIRTSVRSAINQINSYVSRTENLVQHERLAEQNYNLVTESYNEGYASYNDLNTARVSLEDARKNLTNNKMNIINQLCNFASLLELDFDSVVEYLK